MSRASVAEGFETFGVRAAREEAADVENPTNAAGAVETGGGIKAAPDVAGLLFRLGFRRGEHPSDDFGSVGGRSAGRGSDDFGGRGSGELLRIGQDVFDV